MNRTGLAIALVVAAVAGVLFGVYPQLDLQVSSSFFDLHSHQFRLNNQPWVMFTRDVARWLVALIAAPAVLALVGKLILPERRALIGGRAALLMLVTLALGPGVLANIVLKDHWGRARPLDLIEFGGTYPFIPWWDPRGDCRDNCSFIAGEPSGAFWTLAPAALIPPQWRLLAYGGALAFGAVVGLMRIAGGGHFFTDVVFSGVFMFLITWTAQGLLFRWPATRTSDEAVERPLVQTGEAIRGVLAALARRFGGHTGKSS
jgi:membrane-associated PAP2 superfamily phosphatase